MKYIRIYQHGQLVAYQSEAGRIDIHDYDVTASGNFHRDHYANGWRFSTLREAKKELETKCRYRESS